MADKRNVATEDNQPSSSSIGALSTIVSHRATVDGLLGSDAVASSSRERGTGKGRDRQHRHQVEQTAKTDDFLETSGDGPANLLRRTISDLSVKTGPDAYGELFADIEFRLRSGGGAEEDPSNETIQLHMASNTCNYDRRYPFCNEPNYLISSKISAETNRVRRSQFLILLLLL